MTKLLKYPNDISNWIDRFLPRGPRGITYSDVDAHTHDRNGDWHLFQEFKRWGEDLDSYVEEALLALSKCERHTVWLVRTPPDVNGTDQSYDPNAYMLVRVFPEKEERAVTVKQYHDMWLQWFKR